MPIIEVCASNLASAIAAHEAGAHRIELCAALETGGVTPSAGLINAAIAMAHLRVCVLIRPRTGHFCYDETDLTLICNDIDYCRQAGADGVVVGALTDTFQLDLPALKAMKSAAGTLELVFHRAFDFVADSTYALEQLIDLGFHRILTSGGRPTAWEGRTQIAAWVAQARDRIVIMPGSGIRADNIAALKAATGAQEFHLSAKKVIDLKGGKEVPGLDSAYFVSDIKEITDCLRQSV